MRANWSFGKALAALLLLSLGLVANLAQAKGRPDVLWAEGGHSDVVAGLDLSPDGTMLATASGDATIKLWRYADGALLRTFALPYHIDSQVRDISKVRFTPDGAYVVAAVNQYNAGQQRDFGTVRVFRISDGVLVRTFGHQGGRVDSIDVSPNGLWVASAGQTGANVWLLSDGTLFKALDVESRVATDVRFSPDGKRLAVGYEDLYLESWTTAPKVIDWHFGWIVKAHKKSITRIAYSPGGAQIATASTDGTAKLFKAVNGKRLSVLRVGGVLDALAFSPDGMNLATGGLDGTIRLWDTTAGTLIRQFGDNAGDVASLGYADGGNALLAGGGFNSRIKEWMPADGSLRRDFTRLASSVNKVAWSPDGAWMAVAATYDRQVVVFDAVSGQRRFAWNTQVEARDVAFSPKQPLVAMPGPDNTVVIRSLADGKKVRTLVGHKETVVGLGFSHDGSLLASGSFFPGTIRLWNTSDWSLVREIVGGFELGAFGPFEAIGFSPDDQLLGTVAEAAPLVIRVSDGSAVAHPPGISRSATFSPDGQLFVASGGVYEDEVRIFRVSDWTLATTLPTGANDVAFSPDGTRLLAAHLDALRIWRTADWRMLQAYDEELGYNGSGMGVQATAFAPDGARFAYGRYDATVVVGKSPP